MKKAILASIVFASALASANASVILSDTFSYPDGDLTAVSGGLWVAHSGAGGNPIKVRSGQAVFQEISASAEDLHLDLPQTYGTNSGATLYSTYKLTALALPTLQGTYITHYRDTNSGAATGFGARVWLTSTNVNAGTATAAGKFRISIATNGSVINAINVVSYCLRQGSQTPGGSCSNAVDDLKIGTAFSEVAGLNTAPIISSITDQAIGANGNTGPLPFQVSDAESPATALIVTGSSSNIVLVPNTPANISFSGTDTNRTATITPTPGQEGTTEITLTVSDGLNSSFTKFLVRVGFPVISTIPNQITVSNVPTAPIPFTIGDAESPATSLHVNGSSSNPTLVTTGDIGFGGSGSNRTAIIAPEPGQTGVTTITVNVDDGVNTNSTHFVLTVRPLLGIVFSDTFSYSSFPFSSNGLYLASGSPEVGGNWAHASPTGTNFFEVQVITNLGVVELSRSLNEDVAASLANGPYTGTAGGVFYTGFKLVSTGLPSNAGNYFLHLKDSDTGTTFRAKVFSSTTNAAAGSFRLGLAVSANAITPESQFPRDLSLNQPYIVVIRYNSGTGESRLWINPTAESSPSVAATDTPITSDIASIGLREDTGSGTNQLDNLVISGSLFTDVIPTVVGETLQIQLSGGDVILTWNNPLLSLQSAATVDGPYTDIPNAASPYTTPLAGDQQYFRLKY